MWWLLTHILAFRFLSFPDELGHFSNQTNIHCLYSQNDTFIPGNVTSNIYICPLIWQQRNDNPNIITDTDGTKLDHNWTDEIPLVKFSLGGIQVHITETNQSLPMEFPVWLWRVVSEHIYSSSHTYVTDHTKEQSQFNPRERSIDLQNYNGVFLLLFHCNIIVVL